MFFKKIKYQILILIPKIFNGEETSKEGLPENLNGDDLFYFIYVSIHFVNIERSFALYQVLSGDNSQSF